MYSALLVAAGFASLAHASAFNRFELKPGANHAAIIARQDSVPSVPAPPVTTPSPPPSEAPLTPSAPVLPAPSPSNPGPPAEPSTVAPGTPSNPVPADSSEIPGSVLSVAASVTDILSASSAMTTPTQTLVYTTGKPTLTVQTYAAKETPESIPGAPGLPHEFVYIASEWPQADHVPDVTSTEVQTWMKELEGHDIPDFAPTVDGTCPGDPAAFSQAAERGWWTCGGYTRDTDISACPEKQTWGLTFDDGPGAYTPHLLKFLEEKEISATFFVVGSRVIERPRILIDEYMHGHEIAIHTWSHSQPLTALSNEEIVAELGWTRKIVHAVLGVSPVLMRPPRGDIDDRVRAISLAMGLIPVMWTRTPGGVAFDTNDWMVSGGTSTPDQSVAHFEAILGNATTLPTGFITLEHDIYEVTVDMAIDKTLNTALNHNPPFQVQAVGQCMGLPSTDLYRETTKNTTFPYPQAVAVDISGGSTSSTTETVSTAQGVSKVNSGAMVSPSLVAAIASFVYTLSSMIAAL